MKDINKVIYKYALINAIEFDGKADFQAVLGKVLNEQPELKKDIKTLAKKIKKVVDDVNSLGLEKQKKEFNELGLKIEKKAEKKDLPELPNAKKGNVVTAFPPEPSKYPHIGHAKAALINYLYAKKYDGSFILRFEDTNPELARKEYYDAIIDGLKWLGIKWDKIDYISDHINEYYKFTEKLIKEKNAYVCLCQQEKIKSLRAKMIECEHRGQDVKENMKLWKKMLTELKEGEATVRLKIDMNHKNATMRDPSIMRIIDKKHARTGEKYRVWPVYDFGTSVMDGIEGVTHRIRSKEFEMRTELQRHIQKLLGFRSPFITEIARFNLEGVQSSGRIIREMIANKELFGWDDPRLTTLMALKRRGFKPEAIKEFLISTGVSKTESNLTWDLLESFNRRFIDPIANRYFVILDPIEIRIENAPKITSVEEPLHPDHPERGNKIIPVNIERVFVSKSDFEKFKGKKIRLIGLFNIIMNKEAKYHSNELIADMPKIQWVSEKNVKIRIIMNDGSMKEGIAEPSIVKVKEGESIQMVRLGFARLDSAKQMLFYFTHK